MAKDPEHQLPDQGRVYMYRGRLSPLTGLLVLAPLLVIFFSLFAALLIGGAIAALVLPILLRLRLGQQRRSADYIELDRDQYRRIDTRRE
jgi:hypothetical protein